jgi:hypothetical protein
MLARALNIGERAVPALAIGVVIAAVLAGAALGLVALLPRPSSNQVLESRIVARLGQLTSVESTIRLGHGRFGARCQSSSSTGGALVLAARLRPVRVAARPGLSQAFSRLLVREPSLVYLACPPVLAALLAGKIASKFENGASWAITAGREAGASIYRLQLSPLRRHLVLEVLQRSLDPISVRLTARRGGLNGTSHFIPVGTRRGKRLG